MLHEAYEGGKGSAGERLIQPGVLKHKRGWGNNCPCMSTEGWEKAGSAQAGTRVKFAGDLTTRLRGVAQHNSLFSFNTCFIITGSWPGYVASFVNHENTLLSIGRQHYSCAHTCTPTCDGTAGRCTWLQPIHSMREHAQTNSLRASMQ